MWFAQFERQASGGDPEVTRVVVGDQGVVPNTRQRIESLVASSPVVVFMKGNKLMPQCGFSNNVCQILNALAVPFETFDVLSDPEIRQGIKEFSDWPTIPQVYVQGEFMGGSDILIEMYNSGELLEKITSALA